ncbi:amine oxidase [Plakobranchus ocellatus]|uniref:Amine oxidase n=1 Tax=Plakobranchus ocellatus TaxID=259542 RepID=A0AAV4BPS4_9GAST|nr:amine oxidase [Plakobranchus ocellatus]
MGISSVLFYLVLGCILAACSASISLSHNKDGFTLSNLEPNKYFSYGVAPKQMGQNVTISFYDVSVSTSDCNDLSVEVQNSGYFKNDINRVAILCYAYNIQSYTLSSTFGFHVIIRTGKKPVTGQISARFTLPSGQEPAHNKMISGFQTLRQARVSVSGLEPQKGPCRSHGRLLSTVPPTYPLASGKFSCDQPVAVFAKTLKARHPADERGAV